MALSYPAALRDEMLTALADRINGGSGPGLLRIYDGSRPATGGTVTTLLAELTLSDPCEDTIDSGVLTFDTITDEDSAQNDGTATWFRIVDSDAVFCVDGDVGTSGADLNLSSTSISVGQTVGVTSASITEGNA